MEYLEFLKGTSLNDKNNIFDGIDTTWNRVKGGTAVGELIQTIIKEYDFKNPSLSIPNLV